MSQNRGDNREWKVGDNRIMIDRIGQHGGTITITTTAYYGGTFTFYYKDAVQTAEVLREIAELLLQCQQEIGYDDKGVLVCNKPGIVRSDRGIRLCDEHYVPLEKLRW